MRLLAIGYEPNDLYNDMKKYQTILTEEARDKLIELFIEQTIKNAKESEGMETALHCNLFNGGQGYNTFTDYELIQQALFWLFGEDFKFKDEGNK